MDEIPDCSRNKYLVIVVCICGFRIAQISAAKFLKVVQTRMSLVVNLADENR